MQNFPVSFEHNMNYAFDTNMMNKLGQQPLQRHQFHVYPMLNNAVAYHNPGQQHHQFLPNMQLLQPMGGTAAHTIQQQGEEQLRPISHLASAANGISYPTFQQERQLLTNLDVPVDNRFPLREQQNPQIYGTASFNTFHQIPIMSDSIVTNQKSGHQLQSTEPYILGSNASYHHREQQECLPGLDPSVSKSYVEEILRKLNSVASKNNVDNRREQTQQEQQQQQQLHTPCDVLPVLANRVADHELDKPSTSGVTELHASPIPPDCIALPDGRFRCTPCHKEFSGIAYLKQHRVARHSGLRAHRCDQCGKHFKTEGELCSHAIRHNVTSKPYGCTLCSKQYWYKYDLKKHIESNHTEKLHGCDNCSKRFCRKDYLKRHLQTHDAAYLAMKSNRRVKRIGSKISNSSSTSSCGTEQSYNNQFPSNAHFDSPQALE
uniref:C2H2-type domain-containing protein n=1 Tax=Glossina austeni TaxID=7395 RepID=A0A1A9V0G1_GLOAU